MTLHEANVANVEYKVSTNQKKLLKYEDQACVLVQLTAVEYQLSHKDNKVNVTPKIQSFIDSYSDIFQTPTALSPSQKEDHLIPIREGSKPINLNLIRALTFNGLRLNIGSKRCLTVA